MAYPGDHDSPARNDDDFVEIDETWEDDGQLALTDEDDQLPWLEADEYEAEGGFDFRILVYAVLGLVVIGLLLAAIWYALRDSTDPELAPVGSTIEAPDQAYKQRPEDPGGAQVQGTGDQAFGVAEGRSTRGIIAQDDEVRPTIDRDQGEADGEDSAAAPASPPANRATGDQVYVQIGAFGSRADADAAWATASARYSTLSGMSHRVVEGDVNGATVFRLQAIAANRDTGDAACRAIRAAGGDCYIR
ncbi:SPOR domain-containing protein [Erythrobacter arachoides]|uniref:SPOR domain-containing protein n=1 Tax=Aurantiacibacter arachoides TaxID=1850444 RepID=A0A845A0D0_9SPHN|nr:SPOR domain-containing protein [Aurantiacibacter arachoides]MXO92437.1 SPOR domain-containing protein [Aurantiacibacter arachoides]GGD57168.1 hypothetical protein GCM10011411_16520 [Aurantiacibacter arachoides]